ncbi:hypothetical protein DFJ77DRAFT_439722, partial [Powellomyces hirtus]
DNNDDNDSEGDDDNDDHPRNDDDGDCGDDNESDDSLAREIDRLVAANPVRIPSEVVEAAAKAAELVPAGMEAAAPGPSKRPRVAKMAATVSKRPQRERRAPRKY